MKIKRLYWLNKAWYKATFEIKVQYVGHNFLFVELKGGAFGILTLLSNETL